MLLRRSHQGCSTSEWSPLLYKNAIREMNLDLESQSKKTMIMVKIEGTNTANSPHLRTQDYVSASLLTMVTYMGLKRNLLKQFMEARVVARPGYWSARPCISLKLPWTALGGFFSILCINHHSQQLALIHNLESKDFFFNLQAYLLYLSLQLLTSWSLFFRLAPPPPRSSSSLVNIL